MPSMEGKVETKGLSDISLLGELIVVPPPPPPPVGLWQASTVSLSTYERGSRKRQHGNNDNNNNNINKLACLELNAILHAGRQRLAHAAIKLQLSGASRVRNL